jgi:hypothetical protein
MNDDSLDFRQPITLRDGRAALIRVMRPDDKERLQSTFAQLDRQSVYTLARRHGLVRFEAEVLAGNAPMLGVLQRSGLPLRRRSEAGVVHLDLDLGAPPV